MTPCIYLLKNLNRTLLFKKKYIFILLRVSFQLQSRASGYVGTTLKVIDYEVLKF